MSNTNGPNLASIEAYFGICPSGQYSWRSWPISIIVQETVKAGPAIWNRDLIYFWRQTIAPEPAEPITFNSQFRNVPRIQAFAFSRGFFGDEMNSEPTSYLLTNSARNTINPERWSGLLKTFYLDNGKHDIKGNWIRQKGFIYGGTSLGMPKSCAKKPGWLIWPKHYH